MSLLEAKLLLLLLAANGAPILARWLLGTRLSRPLDEGHRGPDGQAWLGLHKTWRGLAAALLVASLLAWLLELSPWLGLKLAALAMFGDLLASFVKRRLGIAAGGPAPLLDQVPEALLPLLVLQSDLGLDWPAVLRLTLGFVGLDYLLSWLLYRWHVRQRPF